MTKLALVLLLSSLGLAIPLVHNTKEVDEWIQKLHHAKEKASRLHFYFGDTLSGKNPSAVEVAEASMTKKSPTLFGLINISDDPLTRTRPTCCHELFFHNWQIQWYQSHYFGQECSVSTTPCDAIIGGTGAFRLAHKFVTVKTHLFTSGDAIVKYHVVAIHY